MTHFQTLPHIIVTNCLVCRQPIRPQDQGAIVIHPECLTCKVCASTFVALQRPVASADGRACLRCLECFHKWYGLPVPSVPGTPPTESGEFVVNLPTGACCGAEAPETHLIVGKPRRLWPTPPENAP